jgi:hypothetical protein
MVKALAELKCYRLGKHNDEIPLCKILYFVSGNTGGIKQAGIHNRSGWLVVYFTTLFSN